MKEQDNFLNYNFMKLHVVKTHKHIFLWFSFHKLYILISSLDFIFKQIQSLNQQVSPGFMLKFLLFHNFNVKP